MAPLLPKLSVLCQPVGDNTALKQDLAKVFRGDMDATQVEAVILVWKLTTSIRDRNGNG